MISFAKEFAIRAHGAQVRKYDGTPYWFHLEAVAGTVRSWDCNEDMICAAWLHDVLEDTPITEATLRDLFNENICNMVIDLTDVYTPEKFPNFNRLQRKALEAVRVAQISPESKWIKLADIQDNTVNIMKNDPGFGKTYKREILMKLAAMEIYDTSQDLEFIYQVNKTRHMLKEDS